MHCYCGFTYRNICLGKLGAPMFGTYMFKTVKSSYWHELPFFIFLTSFSLKSISSGIGIATPACFLVTL